jgi:xanthine dehydrogenase YagS FAD-binding subunit
MQDFRYAKPAELGAALRAVRDPSTRILAGGTELLNWMRDGIEAPTQVVDITGLPLRFVEVTSKGLRLGALAHMSDVGAHPVVRRDYPVLAQSLELAASPQIRNLATIGGNLMQRTRCPYFRSETPVPCNKRKPGSGCAARHGENRELAIFGWSEACVATHPSDLAVALAALDATVHVAGPRGERAIPATDFHRLPGTQPQRETMLGAGELIVGVEVPAGPSTARSHYLKIRQRTSYEFAVVSAAVTLELEGRTIRSARIALGGVALKPWRLTHAERSLVGTAYEREAMAAAVDGAFGEARPLEQNGYKIPLAKQTVVRALEYAGGLA